MFVWISNVSYMLRRKGGELNGCCKNTTERYRFGETDVIFTHKGAILGCSKREYEHYILNDHEFYFHMSWFQERIVEDSTDDKYQVHLYTAPVQN